MKWLVRIAAVLSVLGALLLAARILVATPPGRALVVSVVDGLEAGGQTIELSDLRGDLLSRFTIGRLAARDADGRWLEVRNVEAVWRPGALARGALRVDLVEVGTIEVARAPAPAEPAAEAEPESSGGGGFLSEIDLRRLEIGRLAVSEELFGRAAAFSVLGGVNYRGESGDARIEVSPEDADGDRVEARFAWRDGAEVDAEAFLVGAPGGLIAGLAGYAPETGVSAALSLDGSMESWRAEADVESDDATLLALKAERQGAAATLEAAIDPLGHPALADVAAYVNGLIEVDGELDIEDRGRSPARVVAAARGLSASADFSVDLGDPAPPERVNVQLVADRLAEALGLEEDIAAGRAELAGRVRRSGDDWSFDGDAALADIAAGGVSAGRLGGPLEARFDGARIEADIEIAAERFAAESADLARVMGASPKLELAAAYDLEDGRATLPGFDFEGALARLQGSGRLNVEDLTGRFTGNARLEEIAEVDADWTATLTGGGGVEASLEADVQSQEILAQIGGDPAGRANVSLDAALAADGAATLSRFEARSGDAFVTASGGLTAAGDLRLAGDARIDRIETPDASVSGLQAEIDVSGPLEALIGRLNLRIEQAEAAGRRFDEVRVTADLEAAGPSADLSARAETSDGPLRVDALAGLDGEAWRLDRIDAAWGELTLAGTAQGVGGDLAALRADLQLEGAPPGDLPFSQVTAAALISGETLDIDAVIDDLAAGPLTGAQATLALNGVLDDFTVEARVDGGLDVAGVSRAGLVEASGEVRGLGGETLDALLSLSADVDGLRIATAAPATLRIGPDGQQVEGVLDALDGQAAFQFAQTGDQVDASLALEGLQLGPLTTFLAGPPLAGAVSGEARFSGEGDTLAGDARVDLTELVSMEAETAPVDLALTATLAEGRLDAQLTSMDVEGLTLDAGATTEVSATAAPLSIAPGPIEALSYYVKASGEVAPLTSLFAPPEVRFEGRIEADLTGRGGERLQGPLRLSSGLIEHANLGLLLEEIGIDASFSGDALVVSDVRATGRDGGGVTGRGEVALDGSGLGDVALRFDQLTAVRRKDVTAVVSGELHIVNGAEALDIGGDLVIDRADIRLDQLPRQGKPTLDVRFDDAPPPDEEEAGEETATRLDISLNAPRRIIVEGLGLDAEFGLEAEIRGSAGAPQIFGALFVVRGDFVILNERFDFDDASRIRIDGDPETARLNISARRETGGLDVVVNVTGTPTSPDIEITSEPELPEGEVLSRLLFGRSPGQLSALESAKLAAAVASLARGGGGPGVLGDLENALQIDRLDVREAEGGGTEVSTGKYLARNVYLEVRSQTEGQPTVAIEWQPFKSVELEAETGNEDTQRIGVRWTTDFD